MIDKVPEKNQLMVGFGAQAQKDEVLVSDLHWINNKTTTATLINKELLVRIRHTGKLLPCTIQDSKGKLLLKLNQPTQGIAAGQSAVIYQPLQPIKMKRNKPTIVCLGGGVIE